MGINKVILVGNVGKEPEYRIVQENMAVATFSLATSETYRDKNGDKQTVTEWHNIVLWRHLADTAHKFVHKGSQIYIEGKIRTRSWDDQNGVKRYTTEIYGENLQLLGSPQSHSIPPPVGAEHLASGSSQPSAPRAQYETSQNQAPAPSPVQEVDDLPF